MLAEIVVDEDRVAFIPSEEKAVVTFESAIGPVELVAVKDATPDFADVVRAGPLGLAAAMPDPIRSWVGA
jgi:hypothetical protein